MSAIVRENERSWVIQIISEINNFTSRYDLFIKKAGGESSVSTKQNTLFPDLILYADTELKRILQGWEAKMPDTPIDNYELISKAKKKALILSLDSFVLWNFQNAALYVKDSEDSDFTEVKRWDTCYYIKTREDVTTYKTHWQKQLVEVLTTVDEFLKSGRIGNTVEFETYSETMLSTLVERNYSLVAEELEKKGCEDNRIAEAIKGWWVGVKNEYLAEKADKKSTDKNIPYRAYSKTIILNWALRIMFAHTIKPFQQAARLVDNLTAKTSPDEANKVFWDITQKSDFHNAFAPVDFNFVIPEIVWSDIIKYSLFFKDFPFDEIKAPLLQKAMEGSLSSSKREIHGQFSTPPTLARLLVRLSVINWKGEILDCCCGTGTIPRAALEQKIGNKVPVKQAIKSVWASDKYDFPLQIANIGLLRAESIRIPNRLFRCDAMDLHPGREIELVDPETTKKVTVNLPKFDVIVSNLPFVAQETLEALDTRYKKWLKSRAPKLPKRCDLYCIIALKLKELLKERGRVGIITSNAWLGTEAGKKWLTY